MQLNLHHLDGRDQISGFTEEELLGQPHNIVRHPDMPPAAFEHMWSTLKSGRSWIRAGSHFVNEI
ncbi:PAS domain-containing protein [Aeromonas caviae]|uniref:PAS domain-containing protein n=1 Tax=Aeromonas caviae TaxID=648 RepID=UPI003080EE83